MYKDFQHVHVLYSSCCDMFGWWKLSAVLDAMQTTADRHNELLKCSRADLKELGLTWVLFKTVVQMSRYPRIGERTAVRTYTKAPCMHFIPRYYEMTDERGDVVGRAGSFWALLDRETRKPVSSQEHSVSLPENRDFPAAVNLLTRQEKVDGDAITAEYRPDCCDIDINGHVNNTRYMDWLYNILGFELMQKKAVSYASIDYNYETLPGHILRESLVHSGDRFTFTGCESGRLNFSISGCLADRSTFPL